MTITHTVNFGNVLKCTVHQERNAKIHSDIPHSEDAELRAILQGIVVKSIIEHENTQHVTYNM